jgi:hypothetical protein
MFFELVSKCRNPDHKFFGDTQAGLEQLALVDSNGGIHESTKHIVLAATEGDGLEMHLRSPFAADKQ